ncbi:MAG: cytochrome c [FCB group bacterium]|jgi:mono/diheme cytochrome c family protein
MKYIISILAVALICTTLMLTGKESPKDKGIGPIKDLKLGEIDKTLLPKGRSLFNEKCIVCHSLDSKKVGPPLRNVAKDQTPEFIMNLLVNTLEMQQKDEHIKQLISQYKVVMVDYKLSQDQARELLEYLRAAAEWKNFSSKSVNIYF